MTTNEFRDVMVNTYLPFIRDVVLGRGIFKGKGTSKYFPNGMKDVIIMMDGASWHKCATEGGLAKDMGLKPEQFLDHPPNSADFQGPIEWSHNALTQATRAALARDTSLREPAAVKAKIQDLWEGTKFKKKLRASAAREPLLSAESIAEGFDKLPATYRAVVAANGNWGKKRS